MGYCQSRDIAKQGKKNWGDGANQRWIPHQCWLFHSLGRSSRRRSRCLKQVTKSRRNASRSWRPGLQAWNPEKGFSRKGSDNLKPRWKKRGTNWSQETEGGWANRCWETKEGRAIYRKGAGQQGEEDILRCPGMKPRSPGNSSLHRGYRQQGNNQHVQTKYIRCFFKKNKQWKAYQTIHACITSSWP